MERDTIKIDTVANIDCSLTKNFLGIGEGNNGIHLFIKSITECLVNFQIKTCHTRETHKFSIIGISGNFGNSMNSSLFQFLEETNEPWIGILETAGIDKFYLFANTIVVDTIIAHTLTKGSNESLAIVLDNIVINKTTTMTIILNCIIIGESGMATSSNLDNRTKGLKTAERVALLPPDVSPAAMTASSITGAELRAFYYDAKGNIIQEAKHNAMGGVNYTTSQYGFAGNLLHQRQRITVGSASPLNTVDHIYTYDSRLRPLTVSVQLDDGTPGTLTYAYDDLQRVQSVSLGNNVDTLQYSYTLQGWVSSANAAKWEEELCYQSPSHAATDSLPGNIGFITEWKQQQKGT